MSGTGKVNRDCSFSLPVEKQGHEAVSKLKQMEGSSFSSNVL